MCLGKPLCSSACWPVPKEIFVLLNMLACASGTFFALQHAGLWLVKSLCSSACWLVPRETSVLLNLLACAWGGLCAPQLAGLCLRKPLCYSVCWPLPRERLLDGVVASGWCRGFWLVSCLVCQGKPRCSSVLASAKGNLNTPECLPVPKETSMLLSAGQCTEKHRGSSVLLSMLACA